MPSSEAKRGLIHRQAAGKVTTTTRTAWCLAGLLLRYWLDKPLDARQRGVQPHWQGAF